ncbi:MAG: aminotransferase class III-fold pyridoxal phosphate-dependent enzyme, partial [Defluviitoga tunisiensis]|nr:aminotransferase class III-fold pyridoxal phosphate-dependent enzyme [Defluviitoga tunisiensis]
LPISRTGKLFAYEHYGVEPDIMTLAKGLGGGFPIGAVVANKKANVFSPGDHASTFGGNPLACAVGKTVMNIVSEDSFLENVQIQGNYFKSELLRLKEKYHCIEKIKGKGLMIGCELNVDKAYNVVQVALEKGLLINAVSNNILRFVPPLIVTKKDISVAVDILDETFQEVY